MNTIQEQYQEYAFINAGDNTKTEGCGTEGVVEASTKYDHIIRRTYEDGQWFFMTFKPYDKAYEKDKDWFQVKGMDSCRRKVGKVSTGIYTRETEATKTHINCLVHSHQSLLHLDGSSMSNKYKIFCTEAPTQFDRVQILAYITKEENHRTFTKYLDYIII